MADSATTHDLGTDRIPRLAWAASGAAALCATIVAIGANVAIPAFAVFVATLVVVAEVDTRELRIPNRVLAVSGALAVPGLLLAAAADLPGTSLTRALLGALALGGVYFALKVISPASLGMGDVKLAPIIGAHAGFLSWQVWTTALLFTFAANAVVGIILLLRRRAERQSHLPFAPFMGLGAVVAIASIGVPS